MAKRRNKKMEYSAENHILLRDVAHMRCIHSEGEFQQFVDKVKAADYVPFEVEMPEWPPVYRSPLPIIVMSLGDDGGWQPQGGPTATMKWEGVQLALERNWLTKRTVRKIAADMVPQWDRPAHRIGYAWQVPIFNPTEHQVIRYWCNDNNVDIVDFWRTFFPTVENELEVITTVNPTVYEEKESGSYSPTRRCVRLSQLYMLRNHYLGANEEPLKPEPTAIQPQPQPRFVHDDPDDDDHSVEWDMHDGAVAYPSQQVIAALEIKLQRDVRPFSGTGLDEQIVAISRESMVRYLASNPVDRRQYIKDSGGRNYDCDDFAITLRTSLIRDHGYNCCVVVAGDVHAWCAFILAGNDGPEVVFVEPQTDGLISELTGNYAVNTRCEVII